MIVFWKHFQLSLIIGYIYGFWPEVGSLISELALELDALANIDLAEAAGDGRRPVEEIFIWDSRRAALGWRTENTTPPLRPDRDNTNLKLRAKYNQIHHVQKISQNIPSNYKSEILKNLVQNFQNSVIFKL